MAGSLSRSFEALRARIAAGSRPELGEDELEPLYVELLDFLKLHSSERPLLSRLLVDDLEARRDRGRREPRLPIHAVAYCMHVLRWEEIREAAKRENDEFYSLRMGTAMYPIIDAFDDDWEDREFYRRFTVS